MDLVEQDHTERVPHIPPFPLKKERNHSHRAWIEGASLSRSFLCANTGREYVEIVDEFVTAVMSRWPNAVLQFEDFSTEHAMLLLERYRNHYMVFNDDIQGTAASALAGMYGALRVLGMGPEQVRSVAEDQRLEAGIDLTVRALHGPPRSGASNASSASGPAPRAWAASA